MEEPTDMGPCSICEKPTKLTCAGYTCCNCAREVTKAATWFDDEDPCQGCIETIEGEMI